LTVSTEDGLPTGLYIHSDDDPLTFPTVVEHYATTARNPLLARDTMGVLKSLNSGKHSHFTRSPIANVNLSRLPARVG